MTSDSRKRCTNRAAWTIAFLCAASAVRVGEAAAEPDQKTLAESVQRLEMEVEKLKKESADGNKAQEILKIFKFETLWYLHFRYGYQPKNAKDLAAGYDEYNRFDVGRGYFTLRVTPVSWFEARGTLDVHQNEEGDVALRAKYLYGKFTVPVETRVVTEPFLEVGMVHTPWLDFEEHLNWYRAQGTMFMERNKLFNSSDLGVTGGLLLGRKLDADYREKVNNKYPGSWGSLALGVYNGGGYHAIEANKNKAFEARASIRPAGPFFPNLQLSYTAVVGRGNIAGSANWAAPKWQVHGWMASFEQQYVVVTGQYVRGEGNQSGDFVDWTTATDAETGDEVKTGIAKVHDYQGASGFLEVKLPWIKSSVIGRYDWFDKEDKATQRIIAGYAFHFLGLHRNFVMADVDYVIPDKSIEDAKPSWEAKLTLQIAI